MNEAIVKGNREALEKLIRHGADPKQDYRLSWADHEMKWRLTKWMIDGGVTREEFDHLSESPGLARIALSHGVTELQYCLEKGFKLNGSGVINLAITEQPLRQGGVMEPDEIQSMKDKIRILVEHGAYVDSENWEHATAMGTLFTLGLSMPQVMEFLIEEGADVNRRSENEWYPHDVAPLPKGLTPLMVAAALKPEYVPILLRHGANKTATDGTGLTALAYARKRRDHLRELGKPADQQEEAVQLLQ